MEVHAHSHTPRKKWTHYFWEFLMLFLAVFCGFLAENFREHKIERIREKEYIQSLIKDLEYDTLQYGKTITRLLNKISYYDSAFLFFKNPSLFNYSFPYRIYSWTSSEQFYTPAKQTIEQMKGSGNLRLIHKRDCLDSILVYDSYLSGRYQNQTEYTIEFNKRMQNSLEKIFDFTGLNQLLNDMNGSSMSKTDSLYDLKLIPDYKNSIQEVYNIHVSAKGAEVFYVDIIRRTKSLASDLINYLKKEYHLK